MKKFMLCFCTVIMLISTCISVPAFATARASSQISRYSMDVTSAGDGQLKIKFSVSCEGLMDRLGAQSIAIYENSSSTPIASYGQYDSGMSKINSVKYSNEIYYSGTSGVQYRVTVTIFAKDSAGTDTRTQTFYVTA